MTPTSNRHARRAAAKTAPVEPAVDASAERAAIERAPGEAVDPAAVDPAVLPPADLPAADAAVLPEPTLVAEPGAPQPIVTASPILAIEPTAIDVVQANAAADRVAARIDPAPSGDGPHLAAAGQPTLTIEGATAASVAHTLADGALGGIGDVARDILDLDIARDGGTLRPGFLTFEEIVDGLEALELLDPNAMTAIKLRFFPRFADRPLSPPPAATVAPDATVAVVEVVGPPQGRRRAGLTFGPQPRRYLAVELGADELAALRADPLLAVGVSEVAEADAMAWLQFDA